MSAKNKNTVKILEQLYNLYNYVKNTWKIRHFKSYEIKTYGKTYNIKYPIILFHTKLIYLRNMYTKI